MKIELMEDFYAMKLQQMLEAERQMIAAMPQLAKDAAPELRERFEEHAHQTRGQVERLQRCLGKVGRIGGEMKPLAFEALIREAQEMLRNEMDPEMSSAVLVGAGSKVEHLEIACYGELIGMARALGRREDAELLQQSLDEEHRMEEQLAGLAENALMEAALTEEAITR